MDDRSWFLGEVRKAMDQGQDREQDSVLSELAFAARQASGPNDDVAAAECAGRILYRHVSLHDRPAALDAAPARLHTAGVGEVVRAAARDSALRAVLFAEWARVADGLGLEFSLKAIWVQASAGDAFAKRVFDVLATALGPAMSNYIETIKRRSVGSV